METGGGDRTSAIRISVVVANHHTFDAEVVTGRQIREKANVPLGFDLYRRTAAGRGQEPVPDDTEVELHDGDHFFARPPSAGS